jgi:hypothetical protein
MPLEAAAGGRWTQLQLCYIRFALVILRVVIKCFQQALDDWFGLGGGGPKRVAAFAGPKPIGNADAYGIEKLAVFWVWFAGRARGAAEYACGAYSDIGPARRSLHRVAKGPCRGCRDLVANDMSKL